MRTLPKKTAILALTLTLGLTACGGGGDEEDTASSGESSSSEVSKDPVADLPMLSGKQTAVTLDAGFVAGLTALKLTPGVVGGATFDGAAGKVAFPITGGNVKYFDPKSGVEPYVQGRVEHFNSGLTLAAGGTTVTLRNFVVDPGESMLLGKVLVNGMPFPEDGSEVPLFFLDGSTLNPLMPGTEPDTAVLEGTTVSLTKTAADALNMVFKTDALTEFFKVGIAEITVNTK